MNTGVPSEGVTVQLLGQVRVRRASTEIAVGASRRAAVLTVLCLNAGQPVSRNDLIAAVWGDSPPASVAGNLHTHISELRRLLEPGGPDRPDARLITLAGGGYRLRIPPQAVDALCFEELRTESRQHRATGDRAAESAALTSALSLWHGDALDGMPGDFAARQRARLTELRLATAKQLAELMRDDGRPDHAVALLRDLIHAFPLREDLHGALEAALRVRVRPGTRPGPDREPEPTSPTPLVGRDAELARLHQAVARLSAGRGGSVWLEGGSGIGKSALLAGALFGAEPAGCRMGWAVTDELSSKVPLGVLQECLDSAGPASGERLAAAERVRRLCQDGPLILVIDGLQWADADSRRMWARLHPLTARLPLLLITTAHTSIGRARAHAVTLLLRPLGPANADALIRSASGRLAPSVRHRMRVHAGGNPFYLRLLAQCGPDAVSGTFEPPPDEVATGVDAQLAPLPEKTRLLLRTVAIAGPHLAWHELVAMARAREVDVLNAFAPASAAGVLVRRDQSLIFPQPIVKRVLRHGTPSLVRVLLSRWLIDLRESFTSIGCGE